MDLDSLLNILSFCWHPDFLVLTHNVPLFWFVAGSILVTIEILAPIAIFLWLGVSAYIVACLAFFHPLTPSNAAILYASLSPVVMYAGRRLFKIKDKNGPDDHLNQKSNQLIGKVFTLSQDIQNGKAQMKLGDSVWPVQGADMSAGTMVRVTQIDGVTLCVEPVHPNF